MPEKRPGRNGGTLNSILPGEVLNIKGRGKGTLNVKTILNKWLSQKVTAPNPAAGKTQRMTVLDAMTVALIGKAMKGDHKAYNSLLDRLEGRPPQQVKLTGEDDGPISIELTGEIDYNLLDSDTLRKIAAARRKNG